MYINLNIVYLLINFIVYNIDEIAYFYINYKCKNIKFFFNEYKKLYYTKNIKYIFIIKSIT